MAAQETVKSWDADGCKRAADSLGGVPVKVVRGETGLGTGLGIHLSAQSLANELKYMLGEAESNQG